MEIWSYYFVSIIAAWILAVVLKAINNGSLKKGFVNGGMPSLHTAPLSALTFSILIVEQLSSTFFLAALVLVIVMVDAIKVRYNLGLQGDKINELLKTSKKTPLKVVYGHTPKQVLVGLLIGLLSAYFFGLSL